VGAHDFVTKMCMTGTSRETNIAISDNSDFYCYDGFLSEAENLDCAPSAETFDGRDSFDWWGTSRPASRTTSAIATVREC